MSDRQFHPGPDGFFGIRFESIGGLGAHLAGQMLGEAGVLRQGLNGSHFSSYGSEKKGTPVESFVRFCASDRAIRTTGPVETPQVVAVLHEAIAKTLDVTAGLDPNGALVINTRSSLEETRDRFDFRSGTLVVVDALGIAVEEKTRVNTAMLGAILRVCPFIDPEAMRETIRQTFSRRHPEVVEANVRTFDRGYKELKLKHYEEANVTASGARRAAPSFGYLQAPIGGTILEPANSVSKNLSGSRQGFVPELTLDTCVHCGLCDIVCPDLCLVWEEEPAEDGGLAVRLRGIDYRYCKGCLKCVEVCPSGALAEIREEDGWADAHTLPLYPALETAEAR
jgi:pyruvate ferredoxin oxidoreductase gamma subunit